VDFTEGRLAVKIDPPGTFLNSNSFIDLNHLAVLAGRAQAHRGAYLRKQ
jgi:hypothetical protein